MPTFWDLLPATPHGQPFVPMMPPTGQYGPYYVPPSPYATHATPAPVAQYFAPMAARNDPTAAGSNIAARLPAAQSDSYSAPSPPLATPSPPASAPQFLFGPGKDDPTAGGPSMVAHGPQLPSLAPAAPEASLATRLGLGALTGTGALASLFLLGSTKRTADDDIPPQYVLRGGLSKPENLRVDPLSTYGIPGQFGISAASAPNMTVDEIARRAQFRNGQLTYTTKRDINHLGFPVEPTGPQTHLHHSIMLPPGEKDLTEAQREALSALFRQHILANPYIRQKR